MTNLEQIIADGSTVWLVVTEPSPHIAVVGTFQTTAIALEQEIDGVAYSVRDSLGAAISYAAASDDSPPLNVGDKIRFTASGTTVAPAINIAVSGVELFRG